jgi:hypothetical protein
MWAPEPQQVLPLGQQTEFTPEPQHTWPDEQQIVWLQQKAPEPNPLQSEFWVQDVKPCARPGRPTVARAAAASPPKIRPRTRRRDIGPARERAISSNRLSSLMLEHS